MCGNCGCGHQEEPTMEIIDVEEITDSTPAKEELTETEACGEDCSCGCNH